MSASGDTRWADWIDDLDDEIDDLREDLKAALGYMMNAKIDLETGAPKKTALATLNGGIRRVREAIERAEQSA